MAAPSNVIATPDQSAFGDLPRTIAISGTDMFERPYSTGNEQFSQVAPDVLATEWKGTPTQGTGIIGDSAVLNGSTDYIDLTTKLPTLNTNFIGVSCWFKYDTISGVGTIIALKDFATNDERALEVNISDTIYDLYTYSSKLSGGTNSKITQITMPTASVWHHAFAYHDSSVGTNPIKLWIDGVEATTITSNNSWTGTPQADAMTIGMRTNAGATSSFFDGEICNVHWSTDPLFASEVTKYYNLPTIEVV